MGDNGNGYPNMCRNWMAKSHPELYHDIHTGPGVSGTRGTQNTYQRIAELFAKVDADIAAGLTKLGIAYQGHGSEAAQSGITVLQQWTQDAQVGSQLASSVVDYQAAGYSQARDSMPEPVPVTAQDGFFDKIYDFFGGTTPREAQEAAARNAHMQAAQVMSVYDAQSATAANAMPTFVPPPSVTVEVSAPETGRTDIDNPGTGVSPPAGGGAQTFNSSPGPGSPVQSVPSVPTTQQSWQPGNGSGGFPTAPTPPPTAPGPVPSPTSPSVSPGVTAPGAGGVYAPPAASMGSPSSGFGPGVTGVGGVPRPGMSGTGASTGGPRVPGSGTGSNVPRPPAGTGTGSGYPRVPGSGAVPGAGAGGAYGAYPPGGRGAAGGSDYEHTRRPGLRAGGFGPAGFDPDGTTGRPGTGRIGAGGFDAAGFGPRGSAGAGGGSGNAGLPRGGSVGAGALPDDGVHGRGTGAASGTRGAAGVPGGYLHPAAPGANGDDDKEHRRKYVVESDKYFADDRLVPPPVIGENTQR